MKTRIIIAAAFAVVAVVAAPPVPIPGTGLSYQGPGNVSVVTDPAQVESILTNAPYGGLQAPLPAGIKVIIVSNATFGGAAKLKPTDKDSDDVFALFVNGPLGMLQIDCGQAKGSGKLHYLYGDANIAKILLKGLDYAGKICVDNGGNATGIQIQNISKSKGPKGSGGLSGGDIHSVILEGKLDKLQTNHGGFGGPDGGNPGVLAVGVDSPNGQVKTNPQGDGLAYILICRNLTSSNAFAYAEAYAACIASNAVLPYVQSATLKQLNTKAIGPAVCAIALQKKCSQKKTDVTEPVVGKANVIE